MDNENCLRKMTNIWHFHTFMKEALSVADISDFVQPTVFLLVLIWVYVHVNIWPNKF